MRPSRFPDSLVLIFGFIVLAQLLSYVLPHGEYNRVPVEGSSRSMVEGGTYHRLEGDAVATLQPAAFLTALPEGLAEAQDIIFLIFLVGGVIALLRESGAIDAMLHGAVRWLGKSPWILIAGTLAVFGLGSFTIGMGEEYLPLIPILVTMALAMKMDSIVAMGMIWVPYGIGWATAGTNPFGVVIAQGIAGVPITSGLATRWVLLVLFLAVGFQHVYAYARRIQRDPSASLVADVDYSTGFELPKDVRISWQRILILAVFVAGIVVFVYGAKAHGWYITELCAIFLGIGLFAAIVSAMKPNKVSSVFLRGATEMTTAALIVGFARTIEVVLSRGQIIDTIIHSIAGTLKGTGPYVSAVGMLAVQTVCNFFVPSGSGQAYVTMPIMSPLATLTGVPQQVAVLAYQFGDGFTNMVVPTSALVMGTLVLGKIPYMRWVRFVAPLLVKLFLLAIVVLILAVRFGDSWGFDQKLDDLMTRALPDSPIEIYLSLDEAQDPDALRARAAKKLAVPIEELPELHVLRRAIDARGRRTRFHVLLGLGPAMPADRWALPHPREVRTPARVVIVGSGPAGLFCAYDLARRGIASRIIDRGKRVQPRRLDLALLNREGRVDTNSNYCFGEGGAGTYSDGKLYTRAHKRGSVRDVLEILTLHGAPTAILEDARPHIGSNKLPRVVTALRERLEGVGVEFHFEARLVRIAAEQHGDKRRVTGVELADGRSFDAHAVVLATGHSARDIYEMLDAMDVALEPKSFAMGIRIEHPQALINEIQYGRDAAHAALPSASYRLAATVEDRGVFSFCMCPGGWIVPATTEPDAQVVNGMSLSKRDSFFANSGIVTALEPADWQAHGFDGPLGGLRLQRRIERAAYDAGGGDLRAPAAMMTDFVAGKGSTRVPPSSYRPGLTATGLDEVLDCTGLRISQQLRAGLESFSRRMPRFLTAEAVLLGVESRTSSPVRIPRGAETLESPDLRGLYPAGEGAGYAGGIVSAALDGMRIASVIQESRSTAEG